MSAIVSSYDSGSMKSEQNENMQESNDRVGESNLVRSESKENLDNATKKRKLSAEISVDTPNPSEVAVPTEPIDPKLFTMEFPKHIEGEFAAAIFDLGLVHSSPKILMELMPAYASLTTEHIKSHLQKYRIQKNRSKEEFLQYFDEYMRDAFHKFEYEKGWETPLSGNRPAGRRQPDPFDNLEDIALGRKTASEAIMERAEVMVMEWMELFQSLMIEHSHIQHVIHVATVKSDVVVDVVAITATPKELQQEKPPGS